MRDLYRGAAVLALVALATVASCSSDDGGGDGPTGPDPKGSVRATVTGDGAGLAGVTVRLFADGGSTALTSGTTLANGQVVFTDLTPGAYDVEVVVPTGFELTAGQVARKDVTVQANQEATATFALSEIVVAPTEGDIRVHVVDGDTDVEAVEVKLFESGSSTAMATVSTNGSGIALFEDLTPGSYEVEITLPTDFVVAAGDTTRKDAEVTAGATTDLTFMVDGPDVVVITAAGFSFSPSDVTITSGTTVRWVLGGGTHTVTPVGNSEWTATTLDSSTQVFEHTFDSTGTFDFQCDFHVAQGMVGTITVE